MSFEPSGISRLRDHLLAEHRVSIDLKRDDLLSDIAPGNKLRKLKYNLEAARELGNDTVLSFGGAYSNHIFALAAAGKAAGLKTIGVIRGEEHFPLNQVLQAAHQNGMQIRYMDRETYRRKDESDVVADLQDLYGRFYLVPEGGSNCAGMRGCAEIVQEVHDEYDVIACPVGSGGTMAGIVSALPPRTRGLGFAVLKGSFLTADVEALLKTCGFTDVKPSTWSIANDYHFGGYAKTRPELLAFIANFEAKHRIMIDPVYVGKMLFGLYDLVEQGAFEPGSRILAIHTGGVDRLLRRTE